uniref:Cytochrome P450 family 2 subfamily B member 6 n=1 Tax=Loxodonta africana TaxID=9785 RepID=G3U9T0_LOXAF
MELSILLLLALFTGLLLLLARSYPKAEGHLPPGPSPLPFLGNLLQMDRGGLLKSFLKLQEKYGDVFTVYLGPRPVVMLCGTEAIREALVDQAEVFSGRAHVAYVEQVFQGYGVIFANGDRWKALRRFSLATMRDFGMGKRSVEERIQEEAQCLMEELRKSKGPHRQVYKNLQEVNAFISCSVAKHRETLDPSAPRDFIDTYLLRMDKVGSEIEQVIGLHRPPALDDRAKMPYTDAVIHEMQRFGDLLPIGVPHMVTKDTYFRGYIIPKGTKVFPILSSALHDPRYFEKPDEFNPDHFLDDKGALKKNDAFMPFSVGKRICLGEGIAKAELFLFFTTILQNFSVASPVAPKDISLMPLESGFGKMPPVYQIRFLAR